MPIACISADRSSISPNGKPQTGLPFSNVLPGFPRHTFSRSDIEMTTKSYDLPKGIASRAMRECEDQIRAQHRAGIFDDGDPNHPKYNNGVNYATGQPARLFGYETTRFLARQYK